jgi:hypothetical protein
VEECGTHLSEKWCGFYEYNNEPSGSIKKYGIS